MSNDEVKITQKILLLHFGFYTIYGSAQQPNLLKKTLKKISSKLNKLYIK